MNEENQNVTPIAEPEQKAGKMNLPKSFVLSTKVKNSILLLTILVTLLFVTAVAAGYSYYIKHKASTTTTSTPAATTTTTPTGTVSDTTGTTATGAIATATAGWQTYTNAIKGVTIKYPTNYLTEVSATDQSVCINKNQEHDTGMLCLDSSGFNIEYKTNSGGLSLDTFVLQDEANSTGVTYGHSAVTVNGLAGVKSVQTSVCDGVGCGLSRFYFQIGTQVVELMYTPTTSIPELDTILATFQFTTATAATDIFSAASLGNINITVDKTVFKLTNGEYSNPTSSTVSSITLNTSYIAKNSTNSNQAAVILKVITHNNAGPVTFTYLEIVQGANGVITGTDSANIGPDMTITSSTFISGIVTIGDNSSPGSKTVATVSSSGLIIPPLR